MRCWRATLCELARRYAQQFLRRGGFELSVSQMRALLARHAARAGDRLAAVAAWRTAATVAMDARRHLYALIVGWECGGAEGGAIADAACAAMGRAEAVIRAELETAGAVMPTPQKRAAQVGANDRNTANEQTLAAGAQRPPLVTHSLPPGESTPVGSPINAVRGKKASAAAAAIAPTANSTAAGAGEPPRTSGVFEGRTISKWTDADVQQFLAREDMCNLERYVPMFEENSIDGSVLIDLTDEDLEELGVANKFHRRKIMKKIDIAKADER